MAPKLGIIAGRGSLPRDLIHACREQGREFFVVAFKDQTDPETVEGDVPHFWARLGAAGKSIEVLREAGAEELVMAGGIRRPSLAALRPDMWTAKFFARVGAASLGDDGLLSALVKDLEKREGFRVVGIDEILTDTLAEARTYSRAEPDDQARADMTRGVEVAQGIGALDIGQAAVVQQGLVLATEAIEGTDGMLARIPEVRREGPGGVLVKVRKPDQERRADLPTIGVDTVRNAAAAGLRGIAVEAGGALIVDKSAVRAAADEAGLFVIGLDLTS